MQVPLLTRVPELAGARRLPRCGGEAGVAATAAPAAGCEGHGAGPVEVGEHDVAVADDRAHRDVQRQVGAVMAGALGSAARASILGTEGTPLSKPGQCCVRRVRDHEDITAAPSIAPVRTAVGDVFLTTKADGAAPA
jgi:hypothetical protein